jgi:acyl-CoA synthetase (AMP-forming)/AMP-acid ligase II
MNTFFDTLQSSAKAFPDSPLLMTTPRLAAHWKLDSHVYTYEEALAEAARLRDGYARAGYGHGHRIAILLENRPVFFLHYLALNALGISIVPINPDYRSEETSYLLDHSEAEIVISIPERIENLRMIAETTDRNPPVIDIGAGLGQLPEPRTSAMEKEPNPQTEAALLYTSGTTGRPKGCILTNEYFFTWGQWYLSEGGLVSLKQGKERLLQPLPTFHVNAIGHSFMGMLHSGGCLIILDRFHPKTWWADAIETGATIFHYLGVMPAMLLNMPESKAEREHGMRFGLGGGVDPSLHAPFEARFGCPLLEGWAMTETGGAGCIIASSEPRHVGTRCIGRPREESELRIVDENGDDRSAGEPGELLIRRKGANPRAGFFAGYLKNKEATEEAWAGGWFHTGDIVKQGGDGSLFFVDRKKNIIRRSGENIASAEIELVLRKHPSVREIAVVAAPDEIRGEEVMACISLAPDVSSDRSSAEEIFDWCFERLAYYKAPGYIVFIDHLPTTSTQKVKKGNLSQLAQSLMKKNDCYDLRKKKVRR